MSRTFTAAVAAFLLIGAGAVGAVAASSVQPDCTTVTSSTPTTGPTSRGTVTTVTTECVDGPAETTTVTAPPSTTTNTVTSTVTTTVTAPPVTVTSTPSTTSPTSSPSSTTTTTAPAQTRNCAPSPSACGFPDATNTGPTGTLTPAACPGNVGDNAVLENKSYANCSFTITGRNVTVRNVKVTSSAVDGWAIKVAASGSAAFSNVEVAGVSASQPVQYAIFVLSHPASAPRVTIDRAHIHDCIDCISADNTDITNSYFHAMRHPTGAHVDPIQCGAGDGCGLLVRHNTVFNEFSSTSAVALFADFGVPKNSTIDNNLLAGGGFVITGGNGVSGSRYGGQSSGITITNNRFASTLYPYNAPGDCTNRALHGCYGDITEWSSSRPGNRASGNVDDATGNPINLG